MEIGDLTLVVLDYSNTTVNKIVNIDQAIKVIRSLHNDKKTVVLVGGCFDLLHPGHIAFLHQAAKQGDFLVLLLEADQAIKQHKGEDRPMNSQEKRAEEIINKTNVDLIILLPFPFQDNDYDNLVSSLKPAIIATTKGDPYRHHKERQAKMVKGRVIDVIDRMSEFSTTTMLARSL